MYSSQSQKERIKQFIKYLNISTKSFEEKVGLSNGYISSIRKGIGYKANGKIFKAYPELDSTWLLTGEGSMLIDTQNNNIVEEGRVLYGCQGCKERSKEIERLKEENDKLVEKIDKQNQRIGRLEFLLELNNVKII
jgi:transcriptional regulator with XRE-family HTH domain